MSEEKKPLIRLKETVRFEYAPSVMATLLTGEIGRVLSSTDEHHLVIFGRNSVLPDNGIAEKALRITLPLSVCEILPFPVDQRVPDPDARIKEDGNIKVVQLTSDTRECDQTYTGQALHCLACNRVYERPSVETAYLCPHDGTPLLSLVKLAPLAEIVSGASYLQCPSCNKCYVDPPVARTLVFACPKDSTELVRRQNGEAAEVVPPSGITLKQCITGSSQREYELDAHPFESGNATDLFRARCLEDNASVICKLLRSKFRSQPIWNESLKYELNFLKNLAHDGLPVCVDQSEIDGVPVLIMDNMNCQSLFSIVQKQGGLQAYQALYVAARICRVLQYLDVRMLCHPDLKPSDVMISDDRSIVKLINFHTPSAKAKVEQEFNAIMGEQASFACPDLMKGRVTISSNVYSLGCILYFMIIGTLPFRGESLIEVARKQLGFGAIPRLRNKRKDLPIMLDELVASMMSVNPENRPCLDNVEQALSQISRQVG